MQVKKQKLGTDMEEQNGSNLEKEYIGAVPSFSFGFVKCFSLFSSFLSYAY